MLLDGTVQEEGRGMAPMLRDVEALPATADSLLGALLSEHGVPGGVVTVVYGDSVVAFGAGESDREDDVDVDPDTTVFRVASVAKPVTATLVRHLAAGGTFDLDQPLRDVLSSVYVPPSGPEDSAVTLRHLLTHTSGLDARVLGAGSTQPPPTLEILLQRRLPPFIDPPGAVVRYSNYGYALAGVAVQDALGLPFDEAAKTHLIDRLGLSRTTFAPGGGALRAATATGYLQVDNEMRALPHDYVALAPAGGLRTTATDAGRFLRAVLDAGRVDGRPGVAPEAVSLGEPSGDRRADQPTDRRIPGWFETHVNGHRVLFHDGGYPGAGSYLAVVPELDLGVFVAGNCQTAASAGRDLFRALMRAHAPEQPSPRPDAVAADLQALAGTYRIGRRAHTSFEAALSLFGIPYPDVEVRATSDTTLAVALADRTVTLRSVGDGQFDSEDPRIDAARAVVVGPGPTPRLQIGSTTFERIHWSRASGLNVTWFALCVGVFLTVLWFPIRRALRGEESDDEAPEGLEYARPLAVFVVALHVGFLFALAFRFFSGGVWGITHTDPGVIRPLLAVPIMAGMLTVIVDVFAAWAWRDEAWSRGARLHFVAVAIALTLYIPFLLFWNLIGTPVA